MQKFLLQKGNEGAGDVFAWSFSLFVASAK